MMIVSTDARAMNEPKPSCQEQPPTQAELAKRAALSGGSGGRRLLH